jgi:hypothetical protein
MTVPDKTLQHCCALRIIIPSAFSAIVLIIGKIWIYKIVVW